MRNIPALFLLLAACEASDDTAGRPGTTPWAWESDGSASIIYPDGVPDDQRFDPVSATWLDLPPEALYTPVVLISFSEPDNPDDEFWGFGPGIRWTDAYALNLPLVVRSYEWSCSAYDEDFREESRILAPILEHPRNEVVAIEDACDVVSGLAELFLRMSAVETEDGRLSTWSSSYVDAAPGEVRVDGMYSYERYAAKPHSMWEGWDADACTFDADRIGEDDTLTDVMYEMDDATLTVDSTDNATVSGRIDATLEWYGGISYGEGGPFSVEFDAARCQPDAPDALSVAHM